MSRAVKCRPSGAVKCRPACRIWTTSYARTTWHILQACGVGFVTATSSMCNCRSDAHTKVVNLNIQHLEIRVQHLTYIPCIWTCACCTSARYATSVLHTLPDWAAAPGVLKTSLSRAIKCRPETVAGPPWRVKAGARQTQPANKISDVKRLPMHCA